MKLNSYLENNQGMFLAIQVETASSGNVNVSVGGRRSVFAGTAGVGEWDYDVLAGQVHDHIDWNSGLEHGLSMQGIEAFKFVPNQINYGDMDIVTCKFILRACIEQAITTAIQPEE